MGYMFIYISIKILSYVYPIINLFIAMFDFLYKVLLKVAEWIVGAGFYVFQKLGNLFIKD